MVAAINLTPDTDIVGATITITGTGFTASEDITLTYGGAPLTPVAPISTDGSGEFSGTFIVPASVQGVHSVVATDETLLTDDMDFNVTPNLVITESNVIVGGTINFTGTGFDGVSLMSFTFGGSAATPVEDPITTNATGGFTGSLVIPASTNGSKTLVATDAGTNNDSDTVIIDAKITIDVASGDYGDSVTVTGTGFAGASATTIEFNGVDVTGAALNTNASGGFSRAITVPDAPFGVNVITAEDAGTNTDSENFTVAALITLDDSSGSVGETITVSGHGFAAEEDVVITLEGDELTTDPVTVTTDVDGAFTADFDVPEGYDDVVTIEATDESTNSDDITFTIVTISSSEVTINANFLHLSGGDFNARNINEVSSKERAVIVDIPFSSDDRYSTGGVRVDFSKVRGFTTVYLCNILHNTVGLTCSYVPGAGDSASLGKIKFWGTDGNELADNSSAIASKALRVLIRGN